MAYYIKADYEHSRDDTHNNKHALLGGSLPRPRLAYCRPVPRCRTMGASVTVQARRLTHRLLKNQRRRADVESTCPAVTQPVML